MVIKNFYQTRAPYPKTVATRRVVLAPYQPPPPSPGRSPSPKPRPPFRGESPSAYGEKNFYQPGTLSEERSDAACRVVLLPLILLLGFPFFSPSPALPSVENSLLLMVKRISITPGPLSEERSDAARRVVPSSSILLPGVPQLSLPNKENRPYTQSSLSVYGRLYYPAQ